MMELHEKTKCNPTIHGMVWAASVLCSQRSSWLYRLTVCYDENVGFTSTLSSCARA